MRAGDRWMLPVLLVTAVLWVVAVLGLQRPALGCSSTRGVPALGLLGLVLTGQALEPTPPAAPAQPVDLTGKHLQIVIDALSRRLYVFADGAIVRSWPVAVGTPGTPTPIGHWDIQAKAVWGGAFGARWMQMSIPWGTYGIHGTNNPGSVGSRASHGCVRMLNRDVVQLYSLVQVGTPVDIRGTPVPRFGEVRRVIVPTLLGSDVIQLQQRLAALDPALGQPTGVYTGRWVEAVKAFQTANGILATGVVGYETATALGMVPLADDPSLKPSPPGQPVPPPPPR